MRLTVKKQLQKYLFVSWLFGGASLIAVMSYTHKTLHNEDYQAILFTLSIVGGFMWQLIDFWKFEENRSEKDRIMRGIKGVKTSRN